MKLISNIVLNGFIAFCFFFIFTSCVEEGEHVTFRIQNETEKDISIIQYGHYIHTDTTNIQKGRSYDYNLSEATGGVSKSPFASLDSMRIFHEGKPPKTYTRETGGKSPFNIDYFVGGETNYSHHITSFEYTYYSRTEDFDE